VTLTSSLFVALVIVPTLCSMYMKLDGAPSTPLRPAMRWALVAAAALVFLLIAGTNPLTAGLLALTALAVWALYRFVLEGAARRFQDSLLPGFIERYEGQLRWSLDHRAVVLFGTVVAFVAAGALFGSFGKGVEYFPESMPPRQILIDIEAPVGTRASATDSIVQRVEEQLARVGGRQDWKSVVANTGSGGGGGNPMEQGGPSGPESGRISVSMIDFQDRERDAFETLAEMQSMVGRGIAGAEVTVDKITEGPPQGNPVSIEIAGEDPEVLEALSNRAIDILENASVYQRLVGLESDMDAARPELSVRVDREKAALYDLSTARVGNAIRGAINGVEAAKYRTGNDEYDIVVRLAEPYRRELEGLRELTVMAEEGVQVPLVSVASWNIEPGAGTIRRKDQDRMVTITADVAAGYTNNAVLAEVQQTLAPFESELPPGYALRYTGQSQEQDEAAAFLSGAFLVALMLIGLILISQFNSVVKPVIILTSVIMSTMGVLIGLVVFRMPFGIINTGVGIISLAGIVVNNAIILIDYIDVLRTRDGMNRREALVQGGKTRLRPVLLTAFTTALGMAPLAIGLNFDFFGLFGALEPDFYWGGEQAAWWGPMAVAIIAGILFATFLTLILVPVLYSLVDDVERFVRKHFLRGEGLPESPASDEPRLGSSTKLPAKAPSLGPHVDEPVPVG
ncbi:MAG TPA: efflux RND transporter permease subunit, partial [Longimicrobiales bacterium]|nr:efflux RND transporter permease subunit [Longimicrobiales bacterium]